MVKATTMQDLPAQMQQCPCRFWPYEAELEGCPAPAGCSSSAPPPPHPDAVVLPAISSSFQLEPEYGGKEPLTSMLPCPKHSSEIHLDSILPSTL